MRRTVAPAVSRPSLTTIGDARPHLCVRVTRPAGRGSAGRVGEAARRLPACRLPRNEHLPVCAPRVSHDSAGGAGRRGGCDRRPSRPAHASADYRGPACPPARPRNLLSCGHALSAVCGPQAGGVLQSPRPPMRHAGAGEARNAMRLTGGEKARQACFGRRRSRSRSSHDAAKNQRA